ncbi:tetratricopeptide repeat protein [Pantanalinema sp. GBBB05]|uniref:O-linked N-acetylglucosamine transferase family protein n=1 Tax=Pantanalinema sp. GBBB05 TaxID=2604139 RepID=UPI001DCD2F24|nr:tetratricopeptide repeat protein [Pantanalinema sp. GBBB05]
MDYQKFIQHLPQLYLHWGQASVQPKDDRFQAILQQTASLATANVLQLLNLAVACMVPGEVYCEVGCSQGATLIGALLNHSDRMAYAVDNFSASNAQADAFDQLVQNLANFDLDEQVFFCNQDFEAFFADFRELQTDDRIGVYFYHAAHDYRSQLMGLLLARSFLADQALIIVANSHEAAVQQVNWDFIATHPQCDLLLDLSTPNPSHLGFGHGIQVLRWDITAEHHYAWVDLEQQRQGALLQPSDLSVNAQASEMASELENLHQRGWELQQVGKLSEAEQHYLNILQQHQHHAASWHGLGMSYYLMERYREAQAAIAKAVELDPANAAYHYSLGLVLEKIEDIAGAGQAYQQAISLDPTLIDAYSNLGNLVNEHGDPQQAELIFRSALEISSEYPGLYLNLGNALLLQRQVADAVASYETALNLEPDNLDILENLEFARQLAVDQTQAALFVGNTLYQRHHYLEAIPYLEEVLAQEAAEFAVYAALADCFGQLQQYDRVVALCRQGIAQYPNEPHLYIQFTLALQELGDTEAAIAEAKQAAQHFPDNVLFQLQFHLFLPILYQTSEEIERYRQRYTQGLATVTQQQTWTTPTLRQKALQSLGRHINFLLAYQNQNDRELQKQYGQWVHEIMAANYPQWANPVPMPPVSDRIRVGYVSGCFSEHTVGKLMRGWFLHHDRTRFEIHTYHVFPKNDALTQQVRSHSDAFYQMPDDLEAICQQIRADHLHVLVFPEIGMQPLMTQLAALRLAPIQCSSWMHPVTSGLPTVDYFLSSDLMEPDDAQEHYSETLVRIANLAISYPQPVVPAVTQPRSAFQLREDAVVYLVCQTLCKILPQQDSVWVAIAQQIPQAQFVFIARPNAFIAEQFRQRLQQAFAVADLNSEDFCVILPPQSQTAYWNLNQLADVFLDTMGWSGGHTTLEAIACGLPIVTLPSRFMRGRHSYAILKMLGITDTIAQTEADYIAIATRLGRDRDWRKTLVQTMRDRFSHLYDDLTCITALEQFYEQVVQTTLTP